MLNHRIVFPAGRRLPLWWRAATTGATRVGAVRCMSDGKGTPITMPALSPTMSHGKINKWVKQEGDQFTAGDVLCEIDTDKATVDFETQDDGWLAKILVPDGTEDVAVGTVLALMAEKEDDIFEVQQSADRRDHSNDSSPRTSSVPQEEQHHSQPGHHGQVKALPSAKLLITRHGLDASKINGTGKGGMITKGDVLAALGRVAAPPAPASSSSAAPSPAPQRSSAPSPAAAPGSKAPASKSAAPSINDLPTLPPASDAGDFEDIKPSGMRKVISARLTESKAFIPHYYAVMDCHIDAVLKLRKTLKSLGINVSVNDVVVKAAARALRDVPRVNARWDEKSQKPVLNDNVDISVAVATEGGLITPIVKSADGISISDINSSIRDLASRARTGKLKPEEYQGGSFTISNLGMFGINEFTAVINPPQACILAVGKGEPQLVYKSDDEDAEPVVVTNMAVQMSSDRRVVDEATAALFLQSFRNYVENPQSMI